MISAPTEIAIAMAEVDRVLCKHGIQGRCSLEVTPLGRRQFLCLTDPMQRVGYRHDAASGRVVTTFMGRGVQEIPAGEIA